MTCRDDRWPVPVDRSAGLEERKAKRVKAGTLLQTVPAVDTPTQDVRLGLKPIEAVSYDFDALIDQMVAEPETFHEDADFGPPVGREIW